MVIKGSDWVYLRKGFLGVYGFLFCKMFFEELWGFVFDVKGVGIGVLKWFYRF